MKKKFKDVLRKLVPTLGAAYGGPLGGIAAKYITEALVGKGVKVNEGKLETALFSASPDTLTKLREAEQSFETEMRRLDIDVYKLEVEDRTSARGLFSVNVWPQIVLSSVFVAGFFFVLFYVFKLNPTESPVLTMVIGALTAGLAQVLNFWFGSSLGSKEKTRALKE